MRFNMSRVSLKTRTKGPGIIEKKYQGLSLTLSLMLSSEIWREYEAFGIKR